MPSVGMRRSTRVFVPKSVVKDTDVAKVLRSGKRLPFESDEGKQNRGNKDEWFGLLDSAGDVAHVPCYKSNGWRKVVLEQDIDVTDLDVKMEMEDSADNLPDERKYKMYGTVYDRKRRRLSENSSVSSPQMDERFSEDRMFGIHYVRKKLRKRDTGQSLSEFSSREGGLLEVGVSEQERSFLFVPGVSLGVIVESSPISALWFTCFLVLVLNFMRRSQIRLSELAAFMCCEPIVQVFSRHGIHFKHGIFCRISFKNDILSSGFCQIFGAQNFVPLFWLDFSATPLSFMNLHFRIFRRSLYLPRVYLCFLMGFLKKVHGVDKRKSFSHAPAEIAFSQSNSMAFGSLALKKFKVDFVRGDSGLPVRRVSTRHSPSRNVRRKRSSLRSKRGTSSPLMSLHGILHSNTNRIRFNRSAEKRRGSVGLNLFGVGDGDFSSLGTPGFNQKQTKLVRRSTRNNHMDLKSTLVELRHNIDSQCCNANVLVIESDRCYREEGAMVMLECSTSKEWCVVVKLHSLTKYMHKAHEVMKASTTNRFTHAVIWTVENGWKLEFCDRRDWFIFKELHKECVSRNVQVHCAKTIPVPGVREVPNYEYGEHIPFIRPDSYITMQNDEVERAFVKKSANYDIDSGDEEWLDKLNNGPHNGDDGTAEHVSAEKFEEIIDIFEKTSYRSSGDVSDENKATSLCSNLGSRDITAAVFQYWIKKRKQKHGALLKVFECSPPKKAQLVQENVLRKKRSFKKQVSQNGRGEQRSSLEASAADQEQVVTRYQEAQNKANKSLESAVLKRKRAQILMENADLAAYMAAMAVKIAEVAQIAEPSIDSDSLILD